MKSLAQVKVPRSTGSKTSIGVSIGWINNCIASHPSCAVENPPERQLPTRLINTGVMGSGSAKLCYSSDLPPGTQYLTLSHCWGQGHIVRLTTDNLEKMLQEIEVKDLSKTFQHAISFTRATGIGYLWIDSLCIIQNSDDDWRREAVRMSAVHSNSWCNIAADGGADGRTGCFFDREVSLVEPTAITIPARCTLRNVRIKAADVWHSARRTVAGIDSSSPKNPPGPPFKGPQCTLIKKSIWSNEIAYSGLSRRGWVFQERLLAKRIIHFTATQISFECCQFEACETYPDGLPKALYKGGLKDITLELRAHFNAQLVRGRDGSIGRSAAALTTWAEIVGTYSQCALTFDKDKLVALSAIARNLKTSFDCEYLAGLWSAYLERQLLWDTYGSASRPDIYTAPSWSWASVKGAVNISPRTRYFQSRNIMLRPLMNKR